MKKLATIIGILYTCAATAQWSDISNLFDDSLHMQVAAVVQAQKSPIVINSYPDNGFFVIWEDERTIGSTNTDIYAQKYDKAGNRLWAVNGVAVSNGTNRQHYTFSSNQDYRNRSYAATDSAGGFYIAYADDSVSSYIFERVMVQHMRSNGTPVFPAPGYIISRSFAGNFPTTPQLIADGNKGFFIAWKLASGHEYVYAYCYRDEGGILQPYGGGRLNENAIQTSSLAPCGIRTDVAYPGTTVIDYNIWSDREKGCNVIMGLNGNTGSQYQMLCYNRLWRAKKNSQVKAYFRNTNGVACPRITAYTSGQVYPLYTLQTDYQNIACGGGVNLYTYTNYRLLSNGYQLIDQGGYDYGYPKGTTIGTKGNINVDMLAATRRSIVNNVVSDFTVQGYLYKSEKYDSVPYQRASFSNPELGFNPIQPANLNKLTFHRDTLLASGNYYPDFSLAGGGSGIYAAGLMSTTGSRKVLLQHLSVSQVGDSFAVQYKTPIGGRVQKGGVVIGSELSTGFGGTDISYDLPLLNVNDKGTALFYIREVGRAARVSPIGSNEDLTWGAMGVPVGSGVYNNSYYNFDQSYVVLDSNGINGLIAWKDNRNTPAGTADNILIRHLNKLDLQNQQPPHKRIRLLPNPYGPTLANPAIMYGTSKRESRIDIYDGYGSDPGVSPALDIYDDNYLGRVQVSVFQQTAAIRRYNNEAYLNRNFTVKTDSMPPGASIDMQLYFAQQDFDVLKATDNAIIDPGYLSVIRQPYTAASINAPATYIPVAGEELVSVKNWHAVPAGGYQLDITAAGVGNFFIKKITPLSLCNATATSFTSSVTGATYQWYVNPGSFFVPVHNDANYSGANTATLHLNNVATILNGNLYRCLVDDIKVSPAILLQVANIWTGAINSQWETAGNWSCGTVPTATTDVIVNSGTVTVNSAGATCRSIKVSIGASVSVAPGFKLTVVH